MKMSSGYKIGMGLAIGLLFIVGIFYIIYPLSDSKKEIVSLAEVQEITEQTTTEKKELPITPENQKIMQQMGEIVKTYETKHIEVVSTILKRYKADYTSEDLEIFTKIVSGAKDRESLSLSLESDMQIKLLPADIKKLIESQETLKDQEQLYVIRLNELQEKNTQSYENNVKKLFLESLKAALNDISDLGEDEITLLIQNIETDTNLESFLTEKDLKIKKSILSNILSNTLTKSSSLSSGNRFKLIRDILSEQTYMQVFFLEDGEDTFKEEETDLVPLSWLFPNLYAVTTKSYETLLSESIRNFSSLGSLTLQQKKVLRLQISILTDLLVQENIKTEIEKQLGNINTAEYSLKVNENLELMEEFLILDESLKDNDVILSLTDIQSFKLGSFVSDASIISSMKPLAYLTEKKGNVIRQNLNASNELGQNNMLLYDGQSIETLAGSEVVIVFADESRLKLDENSKVTLRSPSEFALTVQVDKGNIWTRVIKPLISGDTFTIEDPDKGVSLAIRGTSVYFSKESSEVYVVDSHDPTNGSVEIVGESTTLKPGQKLNLGDNGDYTTTNFTRASLLTSTPEVGNYIRDDLSELSLLLDDRKRGFYNNPLSKRYETEAFLEKVEAELTNSLPKNLSEKQSIFENIELYSQSSSTGSIYAQVYQDRLISAIKASSSTGKNTKIQAILGSDYIRLEKELGSQRALERRLKLGLAEDIIDATITDSGNIEDIIRDFQVDEREADMQALEKARNSLEFNGGSGIMTEDIELEDMRDSERGDIIISWVSDDDEVAKIDGNTLKRELNYDESGEVIITATLSLGQLSLTREFVLFVPEKVPTTEVLLKKAQKILSNYLTNFAPFSTTVKPAIPLDFSTIGFIPEITFSASHILPNGSINLKFNDGEALMPTPSRTPRKYKYETTDITLTHDAVSYTFNTNIKLLSDICKGKIIGDSCYTLVASAEYDTPGDYKLQKTTENGYIPADTGIGLNNNNTDLSGTLSRSYPSKAVSEIDRKKSLVLVDGEKGIFVDNIGSDDYLSYDLSSLDLGDEGAIEMSVRGEDLRRDDSREKDKSIINHGLIAINGEISVRNKKGKIGKVDSGGPSEYDGTITDGYHKIILTKDELFYDNNKFTSVQDINLKSKIQIGSDKNNTEQWNGIINYLRIYKKK